MGCQAIAPDRHDLTGDSHDQPPEPPNRPWRVAAGCVLLHVACFVLSLVIIGQPTVHEGQEGIEHSFVQGELATVFSGGYVLLIGYVALLPAMVFLARALGRRNEMSRWAAHTAVAAGVVYLTIIVGSGLAPGAAALWGTHHGLPLDTALAINNVRNFAYFVALPFMALYALGVGMSALGDRVLTRWTGWGGVVVGAALLLAVPAAGVGIQYGMPLWLLWWVGVGVSMLRHQPVADVRHGGRLAGSASVGHS